MKSLKALGQIVLLPTVLVALSACNPTTSNEVTSSKGESGRKVAGEAPVIQSLTKSVVRVKNYNEYNKTLSKVTGIDSSRFNALFVQLKGSLPTGNEIEGMTPFNLLAMSRLADAYCTPYVNEKMQANLFTNPYDIQNVINHFIVSFLDEPVNPDDYDDLRRELENIMNNSDGDPDSPGELFPNEDPNAVTARKNLAKAACTAILASPYITLLE